MLNANPIPGAAAAGWLLAAALAASTAAQVPPDAAEREGCVLPAFSLSEDGEDMLLEISTEGAPGSVGARVAEGGGVVLDLAGCVPGPELSGLSYAKGLVSAIFLIQRSGAAGPVTAVEVETRQRVEYAVTSSVRSIRVRLQPSPAEATRTAEPRAPVVPQEPLAAAASAEPAPRQPIRVLEPLTLPPMPDARAAEGPEEGDPPNIADLVERWARAWSEQRVEEYLSFYATAFRPAESSRAEWEARRRRRLVAPSFIEVWIDGLEVRFEGKDRAVASFWQSYRSDAFGDLVYKRVAWIREDGRWKILMEKAVPPPENGAAEAPTSASSAAAAPPDPRAAAISVLLEGARLSILKAPGYDPTYRAIAYPAGDPGWRRGCATDLVVRAFRQLGVDLQQRIHEDILADWSAYGIQAPDPNIDHRRLRNLLVFLSRHAEELPLDGWQAGDLAFWSVNGRKVDHVGIVSDRLGPRNRPLVIHHGDERLPAEEDVLDAWPVEAHYRWLPPTAAGTQ